MASCTRPHPPPAAGTASTCTARRAAIQATRTARPTTGWTSSSTNKRKRRGRKKPRPYDAAVRSYGRKTLRGAKGLGVDALDVVDHGLDRELSGHELVRGGAEASDE